jgi:DNA anti-recombination protein RmuC
LNQPVTWAQIIAAYMPAAIIMVTILLGIMSNNRAIDGVQRRIDDLRSDSNRRLDELRSDTNRRLDELRAELISRLDRLEERMEHPIVKGT